MVPCGHQGRDLPDLPHEHTGQQSWSCCPAEDEWLLEAEKYVRLQPEEGDPTKTWVVAFTAEMRGTELLNVLHRDR